MHSDGGFMHWLKLCRAYALKPIVSEYTTKELGMIWLYCSCMYERWTVDPPLTDSQWDLLTVHLRTLHQHMDAPLKWAIPIEALQSSTASAVNWGNGLAKIVDDNCGKFNQLMRVGRDETQAA